MKWGDIAYMRSAKSEQAIEGGEKKGVRALSVGQRNYDIMHSCCCGERMSVKTTDTLDPSCVHHRRCLLRHPHTLFPLLSSSQFKWHHEATHIL